MSSRGTEEPTSIEYIVGRIRDIVNCCEVHYRATRSFSTFAKLCTCMDTISDAEYAIGAFAVNSLDDNFGRSYLMVYGLFQAFVIQQDAVFNLCKALHEVVGHGFDYNRDTCPDLQEVRDLRVQIVGHPTLKGSENKGTASYHSISRVQLGMGKIHVLSQHTQGEKREFSEIPIPDIIQKQADGVTSILESVLCELQHWQDAHKAEYRDTKLASIFPEGYRNLCAQMRASIRGEPTSVTAASNVAAISEIMDKFAAELQRRGLSIDAYPGVYHTYQELQHPLSVLRKFFAQESSGADEGALKRAEVMLHFVEERIADLHEMAREIDDDYSTDAEDTCGDVQPDVAALDVVVRKTDESMARSMNGEDVPDDGPVEATLTVHFTTLRYCVSKVHEGIDSDMSQSYASINLEWAKREFDQILDAMHKHGLFSEVGEPASILGEITFMLQMLTDFYNATGTVSAPDADIYAWYLARLVNEVRELAVCAGLVPDRRF